MSSEEIVRTYGNWWSIELFFRASKSLLDLGSEFQGLSYDMIVSSTAIVFTRYILIEWLRRKKNDQREDWENIYDIAKEADRRMYESKERYYRDSGIDRRK